MVISVNSQLGLMLFEQQVMLDYLDDCKKYLHREVSNTQNKIDTLKKENNIDYDLPEAKKDGDYLFEEIAKRLSYDPTLKGSEFYTIKHPKPYLYLIQPSVHKCSELIRVNENFSCSIFSKIKDGEHIFLLGKHSFYRFVKYNGAIRGCFWNQETNVAFEMGFHLEKDQYFYPSIGKAEFNSLVRLMIFVELGDIEVVELSAGRNNGKSKKDGKVTNQSVFTVYVVDSSWNKIIIRTDGFAVRGHFRLQPFGTGMADRKLIWIDAFEKHGYKRRPKAEIIN